MVAGATRGAGDVGEAPRLLPPGIHRIPCAARDFRHRSRDDCRRPAPGLGRGASASSAGDSTMQRCGSACVRKHPRKCARRMRSDCRSRPGPRRRRSARLARMRSGRKLMASCDSPFGRLRGEADECREGRKRGCARRDRSRARAVQSRARSRAQARSGRRRRRRRCGRWHGRRCGCRYGRQWRRGHERAHRGRRAILFGRRGEFGSQWRADPLPASRSARLRQPPCAAGQQKARAIHRELGEVLRERFELAGAVLTDHPISVWSWGVRIACTRCGTVQSSAACAYQG